ncbi:MAG: TolC family protein [Bacteroidales bacterium]|nr:TolC family protein [Bacteroidales bacterium]MBK7172133.1 TolC family protein [Bacteroidales bacterium]
MKKTILLFLSLFIFISAQSQEIWTLEKCIEYALSNNIQIKQQKLQVDATQADVLQNKLTMLPSLNGFASHGYNYGKTVDRFTNTFASERVRSNNFYLSSSISLFDGFQKLNQLRLSQSNLEAGHYDLDKFMDDISLGIATAYLQILYYKELTRTAENQLNATDLQVARLRKLVNAGALAQGDLYTIEAQRAAENSAVVEASNNLDLAYLTLTQMLDLPRNTQFEIESPNLELGAQPGILMKPEQVFDYALETQPSIKSAESRVKSSEYSLLIAKGGQSPTLTMQGSVGTGYSGAAQIVDSYTTFIPDVTQTLPTSFIPGPDGQPQQYVWNLGASPEYKTKAFKDQFNDNINQSISLNLNVPIFNGWVTRTSISKAKMNLENTRYNLELSKLDLRKTIEQAYADSKAALNKYESSLSGVEAAKESYRYAEQKFNVGVMNSVDYNNSKKDFEKAESELLRAKYEFIFKTTVLDFYMGKPISLKRK